MSTGCQRVQKERCNVENICCCTMHVYTHIRIAVVQQYCSHPIAHEISLRAYFARSPFVHPAHPAAAAAAVTTTTAVAAAPVPVLLPVPRVLKQNIKQKIKQFSEKKTRVFYHRDIQVRRTVMTREGSQDGTHNLERFFSLRDLSLSLQRGGCKTATRASNGRGDHKK